MNEIIIFSLGAGSIILLNLLVIIARFHMDNYKHKKVVRQNNLKILSSQC